MPFSCIASIDCAAASAAAPEDVSFGPIVPPVWPEDDGGAWAATGVLEDSSLHAVAAPANTAASPPSRRKRRREVVRSSRSSKRLLDIDRFGIGARFTGILGRAPASSVGQ